MPFSTDAGLIQRIDASWLHQGRVQIDMLRADLIDPQLSGNKYFKLLPNLARAKAGGFAALLSFGGPWSNHLHALAAAGQRFGFSTIGVVRGERSMQPTPCLADAAAWGMQLHFVSRADYARKHEAAFLATLQERFGPAWVIPEGGANREGIIGCQKLLPVGSGHTHVLLACGTGATMAGIVSVSPVPVWGVQVLKGEGYLQHEVQRLLQEHELKARCPWRVFDQWHDGGYGRWSADSLRFLQRFEADTGIPTDPVYGAKLLRATAALIDSAVVPDGARILVIHGGGLQGRRSLDGSR